MVPGIPALCGEPEGRDGRISQAQGLNSLIRITSRLWMDVATTPASCASACFLRSTFHCILALVLDVEMRLVPPPAGWVSVSVCVTQRPLFTCSQILHSLG